MATELLPKALQLPTILKPSLEASVARAALCQGEGFSKTRKVQKGPHSKATQHQQFQEAEGSMVSSHPQEEA